MKPAKKKTPKTAVQATSKPVPVRLSQKTIDELDEMAEESGIKRTALIKIGIARILKSGI